MMILLPSIVPVDFLRMTIPQKRLLKPTHRQGSYNILSLMKIGSLAAPRKILVQDCSISFIGCSYPRNQTVLGLRRAEIPILW